MSFLYEYINNQVKVVMFMKIDGVNSFDNSVRFGELRKEESKTVENPINSFHDTNKKSKAVMYSLAGLGIVGIAGVLIHNLKRGKIKSPGIKNPEIKVTEPSTTTGISKPPITEEISEVIPKLTEEAQRVLDDVNQQLKRTTPRYFGDVVDKITMGATKWENDELIDLHNWYCQLERNSEKGQEIKHRVSEALHKPEVLNPRLGETIDERLGREAMDAATREDMQKYYTEMAEKAEAEAKLLAEKQAKREAMLKLKEENPQEYARLKTERLKAQKLEKQQRKAAQIAQNTKIIELENGTKIKRVEEVTSKGKVIRDYAVDNGKLVREVRSEGNKTVHTIYDENSKITYITGKNCETVQKLFVKNEKGKYKLVSRETIRPYSDICEIQVTRLADGNTKIVQYVDSGARRVTIRDKKGNIISQTDIPNKKTPDPKEDDPKALASWYINYLKLCKEFGVSPLPCGKGGAGNHFYELNLRKNDPVAYAEYEKRITYRETYNMKVKLHELLKKVFSGDKSEITKEDLEILKCYLQDTILEEPELTKLKDFINSVEQYLAQQARQTQIQRPQVVYA